MIIEQISRYIFYPLWDWRDKSQKLKVLSELQQSQWLPLKDLQHLQWDKLMSTVRYAAEHSPYYNALFQTHNINVNDIKSVDDFQKIPVTSKLDIRNHLSDFISSEYEQKQLVRAKTGGSTGVSLDLYFDETCQENRNAAAIHSDMWAGWLMGQKRAALWGNPPVARTLKQKIRNFCLDRMIYLDTMALSESSMQAFVEQWREEPPKAIFGHAHSIYVFARFLQQKKITDLRPNAVIATSMMLLQHERRVIEKMFQCAVTDRYGCEEVGLIASECEQHNGFHLNIEHLYIEFLDDADKPVAPGEAGKITVTDFNNHGMPLLRYQVGDVGVPSQRTCACGRGQPMMEKLEGRVADFLLTSSGDMVSGISLVERTLTKIPGIEQMQLVQESMEDLVINRVKGQDFQQDTDKQLEDELTLVFGEAVNYKVQDVEHIPQEISGKYRFSICRVKE